MGRTDVWREPPLPLRSGSPPLTCLRRSPAGRWEANLLTPSSLAKAEATTGVERAGDVREEAAVCIPAQG